MSSHAQPLFPCEVCPTDAAAARLLGLYPQRQTGLLMQRVKVHGGVITTHQLSTLAQLAQQYTPGYPLHLTTRQDLELHGVRPEDVPAIQRRLADAGLTSFGACGDTLRNVTTCPGNGLCGRGADVGPVSDAIRAAAESMPFIRRMPRKFKISISGCEHACARPWINDLGLVAAPDKTFRAILAGSLGPRPGTGVELHAGLQTADLVPLAVAALRLFDAEGDRERRSQARLRHVRERLGDNAFRERLDELFRAERQEGWPVPALDRRTVHPLPCTRLHAPLGDLSSGLAVELADAVEAAGGDLRLGFVHDLLIFAGGELHLGPELKALASAPCIVTCPGSTWCQRGIVDSRRAAAEIGAALPAGSRLGVCISGCPNNCSHAAVADIGLIGRVKTIGGQRTECFRLVAGGDRGRGPALARELCDALPACRVANAVRWLADQYAAQADGTGFDVFVEREHDRLAQGLKEQVNAD